ncbi:MAG: LptE family protein [bacterium]|uniref:LptE family protein n=1 Tax=Candidatus Aphodosoma intestinipullorum TaxID=2840674 RepID=A0A940IE38_9BACT|nr:LptE family protein [Candidatus Aphodosoma intestinipullorum]
MKKVFIYALLALLIASSCTVSYKFNGASIDYSKVKTIAIADFPNNAPLVYDMMMTQFNEELKDIFAKQTRLSQVRVNGDLNIEGEITDYALTPLSVGSDALAAETRLSMTVNVRFTNNTNHDEDFETRFSANRTFQNTQTLNDVQEQLVGEMIEEIVDQIFNATVANW